MKFDVNKFALASGLTGVIIVGAIHFLMWLIYFSGMMQMEWCGYIAGYHGAREIISLQMFVPMHFIIGLFWIFILFYLGAALFAWLYNTMSE